MCGIAGIFTSDVTPDLVTQVERMIQCEAHRGPDDRGVWGEARIALGNCRLAILDLSSAGHQPMTNAAGSLWCVLNGEIYNFHELQRELKTAGYPFRSNSDTEVILQGYVAWGAEVVRRLRGMFAIAIWDPRAQTLFLARDRFGIKPIYYHLARRGDAFRFVFASEIKPILEQLAHTPAPNSALLYDFLAFGLLDHTDETFFEDIVKLPPAHYALLDRAGHMTCTRYWDVQVNSEWGKVSAQADADTAEQFRAVFTDSVRHHMVSDVPVGSCLSGGLDSSSVVCVANRLIRAGDAPAVIGDRQKTFTSCSDDPRFDERVYSDQVVRATDVQSHLIFPTAAGFRQELGALLRHQEEPFASTSMYAQWCLMRGVRQAGIKVVLDGQGGDEQLLGYGKFYLFHLRDLWRRRKLGTLTTEALGLARSIEFWQTLNVRHGLGYLGRRGAQLTGTASLLNETWRRNFAARANPLTAGITLGERSRLDVTRFSLPVLLRYEDKNSMAFSVEARTPFVDHVFTEFVAALPVNQKLRGGWTKYVLRQGLQGILPEGIRRRRGKFGFGTPEESWFRGELADDLAQAFQRPQFIQEYANVPHLQNAYQRYRHNPGMIPGRLFFRYFIVERWARQFLLGA